ncbi:uncharacterized protein LOC108863901 [Galendromus occidentalis]|uniref:Uncharacterized protein LOC108863901 n=1 Tax=Galendromus occidentalis TaxID=34638 RepID=A0AAJ7L551_9ACAR|nr:uncharacterized protein LOC108863901 [Galendromus occidentalis]
MANSNENVLHSLATKLPNYAAFRLHISGNNYPDWKTVINVLLSAEPDCWEVVNQSIMPDDPKFAKANSLARTIILNSLDISLVRLKFKGNVSAFTAPMMYQLITKEFDQVTGTKIQATMRAVFNFRFNPNKSPVQNLTKFRQLLQDVTESGGILDDTVITSRLLEALPSTWSGFIQSWGIQAEERQTVLNLYAAIEKRETRLKSIARNQPQSSNNSKPSNFPI